MRIELRSVRPEIALDVCYFEELLVIEIAELLELVRSVEDEPCFSKRDKIKRAHDRDGVFLQEFRTLDVDRKLAFLYVEEMLYNFGIEIKYSRVHKLAVSQSEFRLFDKTVHNVSFWIVLDASVL